MTILIIALIVIAIIITIPLVIALIVKRSYYVERSIFINKPVTEVFDYVAHIKNQVHYNVWVQADPNLKQEFMGTDGTAGFINTWNGNNKAGEGRQEITTIIPNERVDLQLQFIRPFKSTMLGSTLTQNVQEDSTKVTSIVSGKSKYPMNLMNLVMDKMLGKDMDTNLNNLKAIIEKR